jgi:hypothetical protein
LPVAVLWFNARAGDFKYTDTAKITGGSLKGVMKFAGIFGKQASQALKPTSTTKYIKATSCAAINLTAGSKFDLDQKLVIEIDPNNHTYSQATFDEIQDAIKKAAEKRNKKCRAIRRPKTPR